MDVRFYGVGEEGEKKYLRVKRGMAEMEFGLASALRHL